MENIRSVYESGVGYAKETYTPTSLLQVMGLLVYLFLTVIVVQQHRIFRWIYFGATAIVIAGWWSLGNGKSSKE